MPATDNSTPAKPYVYQVVEDDWNWAYKLTAIKDLNGDSIGNLSTRSATTDDLETNPFIFVNTKKTDIDGRIKNAESKTMNVFLRVVRKVNTSIPNKDKGFSLNYD